MRYVVFLCAILLVCGTGFAGHSQEIRTQRCLFINSYHKNDPWSSRLQEAFYQSVKPYCRVESFHLDARNNPEDAFIRQQLVKLEDMFAKFDPDVVVSAGEVIFRTFIRRGRTAGVHTIHIHDLHHESSTYTQEKLEIVGQPNLYTTIFADLRQMDPEARRLGYVTDDLPEARRFASLLRRQAEEAGYQLSVSYVRRMTDWESALAEYSANYSGVLLGNVATVEDWDEKRASNTALKYNQKPLLTTSQWMMPFAMYGVAVKPSQLGQYAGEQVYRILRPGDDLLNREIIITPYKFVNSGLLKNSPVRMPSGMALGATDVVE